MRSRKSRRIGTAKCYKPEDNRDLSCDSVQHGKSINVRHDKLSQNINNHLTVSKVTDFEGNNRMKSFDNEKDCRESLKYINVQEKENETGLNENDATFKRPRGNVSKTAFSANKSIIDKRRKISVLDKNITSGFLTAKNDECNYSGKELSDNEKTEVSVKRRRRRAIKKTALDTESTSEGPSDLKKVLKSSFTGTPERKITALGTSCEKNLNSPTCDGEESLENRKRRILRSNSGLAKRFVKEKNQKMSTDFVLISEKVDLETESRGCDNPPPQRRNLNAIIEELEMIGVKCKDTRCNASVSTEWGAPIIKTCSDKWDSQYIPPKVLERYRKLLVEKQGDSYPNDELAGKNIVDSKTDLKNETPNYGFVENATEAVDMAENDLIETYELEMVSNALSPKEEELNALDADNKGRNTLRSKSSTDDQMGNEDFGRDKVSKKSSRPNRDKKLNCSKRKLDGSKSPKNQNEESSDSNKSTNNELIIEDSTSLGSQSSIAQVQYEDKAQVHVQRANEEELVACPICNQKFEKYLIENHATDCATATFRD